MSELDEGLRSLDDEVQRWRDHADALEVQLGMQIGRAEELMAERVCAEAWLAQIQSSASWRITAPFRAVMRGLRRVIGNRAVSGSPPEIPGTTGAGD